MDLVEFSPTRNHSSIETRAASSSQSVRLTNAYSLWNSVGPILTPGGAPFFEHERNRTEITTFLQGSQIYCMASVPGGIWALLRLGNINESFQKCQAKFLLNV